MAQPLAFNPQPVDPHLELQRRLASAPREHAEALLIVFDILQSAHDNGTLDAVHGMVTARDKIFGRLAEFANTPQGETGLLNLLNLAKVLSSVDPALIDRLGRAVQETSCEQRRETKPPSSWQLLRRTLSDNGRRGLSFFTVFLTSLGRADYSRQNNT